MLIKAKTTLFIFGQHALSIMKKETTRNKSIQQKPIFYNQEPLHAPLKAQGGPNMPIVFFFKLKNII
jgi:hypothetical protein